MHGDGSCAAGGLGPETNRKRKLIVNPRKLRARCFSSLVEYSFIFRGMFLHTSLPTSLHGQPRDRVFLIPYPYLHVLSLLSTLHFIFRKQTGDMQGGKKYGKIHKI